MYLYGAQRHILGSMGGVRVNIKMYNLFFAYLLVRPKLGIKTSCESGM